MHLEEPEGKEEQMIKILFRKKEQNVSTKESRQELSGSCMGNDAGFYISHQPMARVCLLGES